MDRLSNETLLGDVYYRLNIVQRHKYIESKGLKKINNAKISKRMLEINFKTENFNKEGYFYNDRKGENGRRDVPFVRLIKDDILKGE